MGSCFLLKLVVVMLVFFMVFKWSKIRGKFREGLGRLVGIGGRGGVWRGGGFYSSVVDWGIRFGSLVSFRLEYFIMLVS